MAFKNLLRTSLFGGVIFPLLTVKGLTYLPKLDWVDLKITLIQSNLVIPQVLHYLAAPDHQVWLYHHINQNQKDHSERNLFHHQFIDANLINSRHLRRSNTIKPTNLRLSVTIATIYSLFYSPNIIQYHNKL